jgi:hypothetical protein
MTITELSYKYRNEFTKDELKTIIRTILNSRRTKMKYSQVLFINVPGIGLFRSHARKKKKGYQKLKNRDRKRKSVDQKLKELSKNNLLF